MKTSSWIAIGLFAATAAWLASGYIIDRGDEDEEERAATAQPTLVEVRSSQARTVPQYIFAQGGAQPFRTADVVAQAAGTIDAVLVQEGDQVRADTVVARIRLDARSSRRESAQAQVETLEADLEGMRQLAREGFAAESRVRELEAQLESARAELAGVREEVEDTEVKAPIPGIVSDVFLNAGQFAPAGGQIIRIVDNSPLRVTLHVSQRDVGKVDHGSVALVSFATGGLAKGRVCFIAPAADPETRTFRVEVRVPNENRRIPSRVSAELRMTTGEVRAHFISPAILALNEAGELGVKSVDESRKAAFHPVEILQAETDGVWIGGLPDRLRLISTGQGFVRQGESVRVANEEDARRTAASEAQGPQGAPLPTSTVRSDPFDAAEELADPPPAEELCERSGADAVSAGVAPSAGQAVGGAGGQAGAQPGVTDDAGGVPPVQSVSPPSTGVTPPTIPSPPVAQPQAPAPAAPQGGAAAPVGPDAFGGEASGGAAQGGAPQ
ncbi:efflux RND transporter periplasmic adaptor subunit [Mesorhizobium sp. WSM2239]|uniref:Efflux RND transporter periplasmic adaptor subunit n=2 Tax=unclassified Mesorhizobium TaxID=325217 RepID=A0AAU8D6U8_9HYPH